MFASVAQIVLAFSLGCFQVSSRLAPSLAALMDFPSQLRLPIHVSSPTCFALLQLGAAFPPDFCFQVPASILSLPIPNPTPLEFYFLLEVFADDLCEMMPSSLEHRWWPTYITHVAFRHLLLSLSIAVM